MLCFHKICESEKVKKNTNMGQTLSPEQLCALENRPSYDDVSVMDLSIRIFEPKDFGVDVQGRDIKMLKLMFIGQEANDELGLTQWRSLDVSMLKLTPKRCVELGKAVYNKMPNLEVLTIDARPPRVELWSNCISAFLNELWHKKILPIRAIRIVPPVHGKLLRTLFQKLYLTLQWADVDEALGTQEEIPRSTGVDIKCRQLKHLAYCLGGNSKNEDFRWIMYNSLHGTFKQMYHICMKIIPSNPETDTDLLRDVIIAININCYGLENLSLSLRGICLQGGIDTINEHLKRVTKNLFVDFRTASSHRETVFTQDSALATINAIDIENRTELWFTDQTDNRDYRYVRTQQTGPTKLLPLRPNEVFPCKACPSLVQERTHAPDEMVVEEFV